MAACGDDSSAGRGNGGTSGTSRAAVAYPATAAGLEGLFTALINAVRSEDEDDIAMLTSSLELADHDRWFSDRFGAEMGATLSAEYAPVKGQFAQLARVLEGLIAGEQTQISVERFERADDPAATGYQSLALAAMKRATPLYSVRMTNGNRDDGFHIWSFVHDDGTFRWVGKLKAVRAGPADDPDLLELRVSAAKAATSEKK